MAQLLIDHGTNQIQLLDIFGVVGVLKAFGQLFIDNRKRRVPILILNMIDYHIVAVFANVEGAEADVGEVGALAAVAMHRINRWHQLARREPAIHFFLFSVDADFLAGVFAALSIQRHLFFCQNMMIPRSGDISEGLVIFAQVQLEDSTVEVHVLQLKDILPVVSRSVHGWERLLLAGGQVGQLRILAHVPEDELLFDFYFVYVWDDLDAHGAVPLLKLQVLILLVHLNDLRDLRDAVF